MAQALYADFFVNPAQTRDIRLKLQEVKQDSIPSIKNLNSIAAKTKNAAYYRTGNQIYLIINTGQNKLPARKSLYATFKYDEQLKVFNLCSIEETDSWSVLYVNVCTGENTDKVVMTQRQVQTVIKMGKEYVFAAVESAEEETTVEETEANTAEDKRTESDFSDCVQRDEDNKPSDNDDDIIEELLDDDTDTDELDYDDFEIADDENVSASYAKRRKAIKAFIAQHNKEVQAVVKNTIKNTNFIDIITTLDMQLRTAQQVVARQLIVEWHNYLTDNYDKKSPDRTMLINTGILRSNGRPLLVLCEMEEKLISKVILSPSLLQLSKYGLAPEDAINRKVDCKLLFSLLTFSENLIDYNDPFWFDHITKERANRLPEELRKRPRQVTNLVKFSIDYAAQAERMGIHYIAPVRYDTEKDASAIEIAVPLLYVGRKTDTILVLRRTEKDNYWKIITVESGLMAYMNLRAYNVYDTPAWFSY